MKILRIHEICVCLFDHTIIPSGRVDNVFTVCAGYFNQVYILHCPARFTSSHAMVSQIFLTFFPKLNKVTLNFDLGQTPTDNRLLQIQLVGQT